MAAAAASPTTLPFGEESLVHLKPTMSDVEIRGFVELCKRFLAERGKQIEWEKIKLPTQETVIPYSSLAPCSEALAKSLLSKVAIVKLNGGLGTTMGCTGPKSVIEVRDGLNFLDITIKQVEHLNKTYGLNVPLLLMNSFNTHDDTEKILKSRYSECSVRILSFMQSRYPRLFAHNLEPVAKSANAPISHWFPPGHGDVYRSLMQSGLMDKLQSEGFEYLFISNVDNLGATLDATILQHMASSGTEFLMEVTDKTNADIKGGTLINYEGRVKLLEVAQVPKKYENEFKSIRKFKIFNTNNLWISLAAMRRALEASALNMDIILNQKDLDGARVFQLEMAAGAAIECFAKSIGVNVPRSRFIPVKGTADLLMLQSNLYRLQDNGVLIVNPLRPYTSLPAIKLGAFFQKVSEYQGRVRGPVDMVELDHLTISGDVVLGQRVVLKGTVIIVAGMGSRIEIPDGTELENKVVTVGPRIVDHI